MTGAARVLNKRSLAQASQRSLSKKLHIKTFGCQMNAYDSERMAEALEPAGYVLTEDQDRGRSRHSQYLPHQGEGGGEGLFRARPRPARQGRAAERGPRHADCRRRLRRASRGGRDHGAGADRRYRGRAAELSSPRGTGRRGQQHGQEACSPRISRLRTNSRICPSAPGRRSRVSAFLTVQEGCDKFCTFCVVPYTRGAEFSRATGADHGGSPQACGARRQAEITLLGQNVNAYHGTGPRWAPMDARQAVAAARRSAVDRAAPLHHQPPARHGR